MRTGPAAVERGGPGSSSEAGAPIFAPMAKTDPPFDRVRRLALKLPRAEQGTTFGFPAFKVDGKTFAWFPKKKEVEEGSLGVRMSFVDRDLRMAANPAAYYVTPHYKDYTSVLARVWELTDGELRELLSAGHEFMAKSKR
jgi:hypothetical protein